MIKPEWLGAIGETFGAIGTVAAFFVALYQIKIERDYRREQKRRDDEAEQRRQAEQVTCWISKAKGTVENFLVLSNASSSLVTYAAISIRASTLEKKIPEFRIYATWITPGLSYILVNAIKSEWFTSLEIDLVYTDARGQSWLREYGNAPKPIDKNGIEYYSSVDVQVFSRIMPQVRLD